MRHHSHNVLHWAADPASQQQTTSSRMEPPWRPTGSQLSSRSCTSLTRGASRMERPHAPAPLACWQQTAWAEAERLRAMATTESTLNFMVVTNMKGCLGCYFTKYCCPIYVLTQRRTKLAIITVLHVARGRRRACGRVLMRG